MIARMLHLRRMQLHPQPPTQLQQKKQLLLIPTQIHQSVPDQLQKKQLLLMPTQIHQIAAPMTREPPSDIAQHSNLYHLCFLTMQMQIMHAAADDDELDISKVNFSMFKSKCYDFQSQKNQNDTYPWTHTAFG